MQPKTKVLFVILLLIWPFVVAAQAVWPLMTNSSATASIDQILTITLNNPAVIDLTSTIPDLENFGSSTKAFAQTDIYQYQVASEPQIIQFNFQASTNQMNDFGQKLIYIKTDETLWQALPTYHNTNDNSIWATTSQARAQVILGSKINAWEGQASWYSWKHCPCAAFKFAPKNSLLKVTNLQKGKNFGKMKYAQVNDYGPEDSTNRLIDLDKTVFSGLSNLSAGLVRVQVELITNPKELAAAKKSIQQQKSVKTK
ncbi:MAG: hypothetical protein NTV81_01230 [Candidatus Komeilibacteria bacterium]|nr:hypothetical protein [Candidatus Komeilibacteria bacterium]